MSNTDGFAYSPEAKFNRYLMCKKSGYLHIFVEDEGKEYIYEKIFERMFQVPRLSLIQIFAMGGKKGVEDAYHRTCNSSDKVFFIADGDFDLALGKQQIQAENFVYLKRYNIESYLIYQPAIINFMRDQLEKIVEEVEKELKYEEWEFEVIPFLKKVFAAHCIFQINVQSHQIGGIGKNVGKGTAYFLDQTGHPKIQCYNNYIAEIESSFGIKTLLSKKLR